VKLRSRQQKKLTKAMLLFTIVALTVSMQAIDVSQLQWVTILRDIDQFLAGLIFTMAVLTMSISIMEVPGIRCIVPEQFITVEMLIVLLLLRVQALVDLAQVGLKFLVRLPRILAIFVVPLVLKVKQLAVPLRVGAGMVLVLLSKVLEKMVNNAGN
jgi:hypothetical protein